MNIKNMDILTLLKANIKHKKGTFISIIILMTIVTTVICAIISVKDNYTKSFEKAYKNSDCGEMYVMAKSKNITQDMRQKLGNCNLIEKVDYYDTLMGNGLKCVKSGNKTGNVMFMTKIRKNIRLYNKKENGFEKNIPALKEGEIYLPFGFKDMGCRVDEKVLVDLINKKQQEFTVKGFVEEPSMGSATIGVKQIFISDSDYDEIYEKCKPYVTKDVSFEGTILNIHQSENSKLSATKFSRKVNLETKIADMGFVTINKDSIKKWSTMLPDIIINIVIVFCIFLFVIVLIVMSHSISTEIELEYTTLGILKSQGFTSGKIRFIFFLQYLIAQITGIILGFIFELPLEKFVAKSCQTFTAILAKKGLSLGKCMLFVLAFLSISSIIIFIKTHKLAKISPVKAINGGHEQIYFESRLNMPISKKFLSPTLALRQFTSGKKRYAGIILIATILTFFMITVNLIGNILNSQAALRAMGIIEPDIMFYFDKLIQDKEEIPLEEIDKIINNYSSVEEKNTIKYNYCSINGECIACESYKFPEHIPGILKGREPKYENELVISPMVGEALDLKFGDKVTVSYKNKEKEFIICGIFQSTNDSGMNFAINFDGAKNLGIDTQIYNEYFLLKDKSAAHKISNAIKEKYGDKIGIYISKDNQTEMDGYKDLVNLLKAIIYSFSIIFAFVVVRMVCVKTFIQERKDIGIFKALGFTSNKLRLGFAIRFFISAIIGSAIGIILSILLSAKAISAAFSMLGIIKIQIEYTTMSVIVPVLVICIGFFVFSFIASRKIRKVETKELIME